MNASETEKVARTVANATELHRSYILVLQREIYLTHPFVAYFVDTRVMCTSLILDTGFFVLQVPYHQKGRPPERGG